MNGIVIAVFFVLVGAVALIGRRVDIESIGKTYTDSIPVCVWH